MRKLEAYWASKKEWVEQKGFDIVLRKDAPKEAQESYKRYLKQVEKHKNVK